MHVRLAIAMICWTGLAHAQDVQMGAGAHQTVFFVPQLSGAVTFDVGAQGRIDGFLQEDTHGLPTDSMRLHLGYLHYLEPHGRWAVGGYLGGGFSLPDTNPDAPTVGYFDVGTTLRWRGISDDFVHWTVGLFAEAGPLHLSGSELDGLAFHWAAGLENGPGYLFHLSPYVFGELLARVGVESIYIDGRRVTAVTAGLRLVFDFALRGARTRG